jgi:methyltransferase (TIGR00027 family)
VRADRPSRTALQVAQAVAYLAADERVGALLPPGLAETNARLLLASGLISPRRLRSFARPGFRRLREWVDSLGAHGQLLHVGLRKRLVHDQATAAITAGCGQLLVLGGGLDPLAWRLATEHPGVSCFEVDHPASQARKRAALAALGPLPPNLHLLPVDLAAGGLAGSLALPPWDSATRTFAVAEAVLMYLPCEAVERTLRDLHAASGAGSALLFSYLRRDARGGLLLGKRPRLAALALAMGGEPLRWAVGEGELAAVLGAAGWHLEVETFDLRARYLEPAGLGDSPLADIELFALARRR